MWTREELKTRAKDVLRRSFGMAILVCFVAGLLGAASNSAGSVSNVVRRMFSSDSNGYYDFYYSLVALLIFCAILIFVSLLVMAFFIFVSAPVRVGLSRWNSRNRESALPPPFGMLFSCFKSGEYLRVVGAMAWWYLIISLWTLLCIVPGIVMTYTYRMVPWILADNPNIGYKRAMELSKQMTMGHKADMFVLDLSFFGWGLLAVFTCGLGFLILTPYIMATEAELYAVLRHNALAGGMCRYEELGFAQPATPPAPPVAPFPQNAPN